MLPVCQLHVCLLACVLVPGLGQFLGNNQLGDVYSVTEQVRNGLLRILHSALWIPVKTLNILAYTCKTHFTCCFSCEFIFRWNSCKKKILLNSCENNILDEIKRGRAKKPPQNMWQTFPCSWLIEEGFTPYWQYFSHITGILMYTQTC